MQRFRKGNTLRTKTFKLKMPREYKAKYFVAKTWQNPYTDKEKVQREKDRIKRESLFSYDQLWTGNEDGQTGMDHREDVLLRDGPTCATCGSLFGLAAAAVRKPTVRTWRCP